MASSLTLRSPIRVGMRRVRKLKFRPINAKLLCFAEELRAGLDARNCDDIQRAVATVALAADLPINVASALSADDLACALDGWNDALAAYSVGSAHE